MPPDETTRPVLHVAVVLAIAGGSAVLGAWKAGPPAGQAPTDRAGGTGGYSTVPLLGKAELDSSRPPFQGGVHPDPGLDERPVLSLPLRAVHVTPEAWVKARLRRGVLKLVRERKINGIQLDLKDETGMIGYRSTIPLAKRIGSSAGTYDLPKAVRQIHELGVPVIGRIVCFADPVLAERSWATGKTDRVIQTRAGQPFQVHGGFTNFADPDVIRYNIDIAQEAAEAGVDHILYDYVRRPDAALSALHIPGLKGDPSDAVARFVRLTKKRLKPYGTLLGVSVFGIASTRPDEISQNIPKLAKHSDYIAPMVYPSHWGPGEYGVPDPINQPYDIVRRSLPDFKRAVRGRGTKVIPWLQDFTLGVYYGPDKVKAQLKAASDAGIGSWILWDPFVTYTGEALPRMSKQAFAGKT